MLTVGYAFTPKCGWIELSTFEPLDDKMLMCESGRFGSKFFVLSRYALLDAYGAYYARSVCIEGGMDGNAARSNSN